MASAVKKYNLHELYQENAARVTELIRIPKRPDADAIVEVRARKLITDFFTESARDILGGKMRKARALANFGKVVSVASFPSLVIFPSYAVFSAFIIGCLAIAAGDKYGLIILEKYNALIIPPLYGFAPGDKGDKKIYNEANDRIETLIQFRKNPAAFLLG